ncbi:hypothetical protein B0H10DRAFT_1940508 [Mycena sp. CBHHK59/15]|nr:hypothetical protein B0H10DRAFT_1940508 [Mycena sp. CBHHK59/15]
MEELMKEHLGIHFTKSVWEIRLKRLIEFEGDGDEALKLVADLRNSTDTSVGNSTLESRNPPSQLAALEVELMAQVADLHGQKCIHSWFSMKKLLPVGTSSKLTTTLRMKPTTFQRLEPLKFSSCVGCWRLKGDLGQSMELNRALQLFRGHVQQEELMNARQLTLTEAWGTKSNA